MKVKGIFVLVMTPLIFGCMTPANVKRADEKITREAMAFVVDQGRAKVYFVNGKQIPNMFGMKHQYPSDLYLNGVLIGSMNKENVMVFELAPGTYRLHWNVRSTDPIDKQAKPEEFVLTLVSGQITVLSGDYNLGGAAAFGLLGSFFASPRTNISGTSNVDVSDKVVVTPQLCPVTLCK
jgi:hypothetical protein